MMRTTYETMIVLWVKGSIFKSRKEKTWNVIFLTDFYRQYMELCKTCGEQTKTERTVIRNTATVLYLFRIFDMSGHEFGRGNKFFYSEK